MKAAIISIGDEILIGQIVDTNSSWIAENLNLIGIEVIEKRSIADKDSAIKSTLENFEGTVDLVLLTGGLGPTRDDITKKSLNEYFRGKLILNESVLDHIKDLFSRRGFQLTELNRLQSEIPDVCQPLKNSEGTAPGMLFERSGTMFVSMPGVPFEMKAIMMEEVIPLLKKKLNGRIIHHRTVMTTGIPESFLAAKIKDWETGLPHSMKLAYLPRPGIVRLRLSATGKSREEIESLMQKEIRALQKIIPESIFATDDVSIELTLVKLLIDNNMTVSLAESCTGGKIASLITSIPGSSACFPGAVVSYSNESKINLLGVDKALIQRHGAVSREVVEAMALGVKEKFRTDFSVSVSGIAGPQGGSENKAVGTTWIAVSTDQKCRSAVFNFGDNRERNIQRSSIAALNMLRIMVLEKIYEK